MTTPTTARDLAARLLRLDIAGTLHAALAAEAASIADDVRAALSHPPGTQPHTYPWLRTGELRDSIGHAADADDAVVGTVSPVARYQEFGTAAIPPRPFLAPVAAAHAASAAHAIGAAAVAAIRSA